MHLDYTDEITKPLFQNIKKYENHEIDELPDGTESLKNLLRAIRTSIIKDPNLSRLFTSERSELDAIIHWLQDYQKKNNENTMPGDEDDDSAAAGAPPPPKEE